MDLDTYHLMVEELGEPDEMDGDNTWVSYQEINHGQLPEVVKTMLIARETPFAWWNGAGMGYPEGVMLFNGTDLSEWPMLEGEIMLTTTNAADADLLSKATAAQAFWETL
jgi:hypothetical protein